MARYALLYPFKPGMGAHAEEIFRMGGDPPQQEGGGLRLLSTTVFRKGDTVVRMFEIDGDLQQAVEHMVRATELSDTGTRLQPMLEGVDLTTTEGLRSFFRDQMMEVVTHREVPPEFR